MKNVSYTTKHLNFNTILVCIANALIGFTLTKADALIKEQASISATVGALKQQISQMVTKAEFTSEISRLDQEIDRIKRKDR